MGSRGGMSMDLVIRANEFRLLSETKRYSLDQRGGCLQDSILPNRRLCYDGQEMIWECLCRHICECGYVIEPRVPEDSSMVYGKLSASLKGP
ncbi:hypothetical protein N7509_010406 [Penicillium cosmopolitanum]|uniref:Uncharacterized protein n=1 Tax=Penicillium cosmopolitanum TaxID=1131564 RepID=A0A9W9VRJ5_9EURO|nr:uncharacterized protein N7509_010406 [Penicillium cosmopolitanum]KAJ5387865.1 hypothetical protein N7509_010406 [Penicillium cosmopolitanum]